MPIIPRIPGVLQLQEVAVTQIIANLFKGRSIATYPTTPTYTQILTHQCGDENGI